jgi:hypothetical protein
LRALSIINGEQSFEGADNVNKNIIISRIAEFPAPIYALVNLEELNLVNIGLKGRITPDFLNLNKLRHINLAENDLSANLPYG